MLTILMLTAPVSLLSLLILCATENYKKGYASLSSTINAFGPIIVMTLILTILVTIKIIGEM